jgi:serine/threonine protein kinase
MSAVSGVDVEGIDDTLVPVPPPGFEKTAPASGKAVTAILNSAAATPSPTRTTQARTTVLPSSEGAQLGQQERDRYKLVRVLGAGGMGEVSLARDQDIDRAVAVKYLHPGLADPGMLARFVEEIRTVGHLEHPNIVPIHDVGLDEQGRYFFVMKHLDGETLEQIIEKLRAHDPAYEARFPYERRADVIVGVLRALQFAHERGIIHRDIKPANIMVGKHGEVVLMDWGIAKSIGGKEVVAGTPAAPPPPGRLVETQLGSLVGTPLYMAPEQAAGKSETMDARSDLFSVSVVLHEFMSLEHYLGDPATLDDILQGIGNTLPGTLPISYKKYPMPPAGYVHAARKGLQKDPADRHASANEMIAFLNKNLDGVPEVHCPVTAVRSTVGRAGRLLDHRPTLALGLLTGFLALFGTSTVISVIALSQWLGR